MTTFAKVIPNSNFHKNFINFYKIEISNVQDNMLIIDWKTIQDCIDLDGGINYDIDEVEKIELIKI